MKRKATFNLKESTHQGLKINAAVRQHEMVELVEEALSAYFGWNKMTKIEHDELTIYRTSESMGTGRKCEIGFSTLSNMLEYGPTGEVAAQLLAHLNNMGFLGVEVNDGKTGYIGLTSYPNGTECMYRNGGALRLQLTIPGRLRYQQLEQREAWEKEQEAGEDASQSPVNKQAIEMSSGPPFRLSLSGLGFGAGDRPALVFDVVETLEQYLRKSILLPADAVSRFHTAAAAGTGHAEVWPLPNPVVEQFYRDFRAS